MKLRKLLNCALPFCLWGAQATFAQTQDKALYLDEKAPIHDRITDLLPSGKYVFMIGSSSADIRLNKEVKID